MATVDENEITDDEREQILKKANALVLTIVRSTGELQSLIGALRVNKKVGGKRKDKDEFGDPTYAFEVKVRIPEDIKLTRKMRNYAAEKGFNASTVQAVWTEFFEYYRRTGKKFQDWTLTWYTWVRTEVSRRAEKGGNRGSSRDMKEL